MTDLSDRHTSHILKEDALWLRGLAISKCGRFVVITGGQGNVEVWDLNDHRLRVKLDSHKGVVVGAAFSGNGKWLATLGADGSIGLWCGHTFVAKSFITMPASEASVIQDVNADNFFVVGTRLGEVVILDGETGHHISLGRGHLEAVTGIASDAESALFYTGSFDGQIVSWKWAEGAYKESQRVSIQQVNITSLARVTGQHNLAVGCIDGRIQLISLNTENIYAELRARLPYEGYRFANAIGLTEQQLQSLKMLGARTN